MICSSKTARVPFKEVFRLELLKSCSQVLPRDHSRAQNIVFFCMQQPTNHLDPYSLQPNKLQGRQPLVFCQQELWDKKSHCEQCVTLLPLSADWTSKALSTCQRKHTQGVLCGHAWQGRTGASQILCFVKTRLSSLKDLASQAQAHAVREASENSEAPGVRRN